MRMNQSITGFASAAKLALRKADGLDDKSSPPQYCTSPDVQEACAGDVRLPSIQQPGFSRQTGYGPVRVRGQRAELETWFDAAWSPPIETSGSPWTIGLPIVIATETSVS